MPPALVSKFIFVSILLYYYVLLYFKEHYIQYTEKDADESKGRVNDSPTQALWPQSNMGTLQFMWSTLYPQTTDANHQNISI